MRLPALRPLLTYGLLLVVAVCALTPTDGGLGGLYQGLTRRLHGVTVFFVQPIAHVFSLTGTLRADRPQPDNLEDLIAANGLLQLRQGEIVRLQAENERLRKENAALQKLAEIFDPNLNDFVRPAVTGRSTDPAGATLTINAGYESRLVEGLVVVSGPNLLGHVVEVGPRSATVELITAPGTRINAKVTPAVWPAEGLPETRGRLCQLDAQPDGQLEAIVEESYVVEVGDLARLEDNDWPYAARGMVLGEVVAVEDAKELALRKKIVVRPIPTVRFLGRVTVVVPRGEGAAR